MCFAANSLLSNCICLHSSHLFLKRRHGSKHGRTILATKREKNSNTHQPEEPFFPPLTIPTTTLLAQSAVAVLGLGFIDAGYSGDWSRVGVISEESEHLLKAAAFVVVPLCVALIFSISRKPKS